MKSIIFYLILLLPLTACTKKNCPDPKPGKLILQPGTEGKDAGVSSISPDNRYSDEEKVTAFAWTSSGNLSISRFFFDFDFANIPVAKTIVGAKLYLYADTTFVWFGSPSSELKGHSKLSGTNDFSIWRVTSPWSEATLTWNTQPTYDTINKVSLPSSTRYDEAYIIDVTQLVKDQVASPSQFHGFMLRLNQEVPFRRICFYTSDGPYPDLHPKLEIEYK